jgi:hypothetical protein
MVERAMEFLKVKLIDWTESWLLNLRQEYRGAARALTVREISALRGYYSDDFLGRVRVVLVDRIPNPSFFGSLSKFGLPVPWDFSAEPGLAVVDVVFLSKELVPEGGLLHVLFEELVHIQQFQTLGISRLVGRYVRGLFMNGFDYARLPMERQADELRRRFDVGLAIFSVEHEVEGALLQGRI